MAFKAAKAHESGPGTYRFLVAQAVLQCMEDRHDDDAYAESVEELESVCQPLILSEQKWYRKAIHAAVVDESGRPMYDEDGEPVNVGAEIPVQSLRRKKGILVTLAHAKGVLGHKPVDVEDARSFFMQTMKKANRRTKSRSEAQGTEEDEEDEEG